MRKSVTCASVAFVLCASISCIASADDVGPGINPYPAGDNQWHLGYTVPGYSSEGKFERVALHNFGDRDTNHPQETNDIYKDAINKIVLASDSTGCVNTGPSESNACVYTVRAARSLDEHQVQFSFKNWGGRCDMWVQVIAYAPALQWHWSDPTPWSRTSPFVVVVPENAREPVVFGKLHGSNIFFKIGPGGTPDNKAFKLMGPPDVVPGFGTIYRYKAS